MRKYGHVLSTRRLEELRVIYLIVSDSGAAAGDGIGSITGFTFLERFYSVFDTGNKRVGLATTPFTTATTN